MSLVRDPATGETITEVAESGAAEVAAGFERARAGLAQWRALSASRRGAILVEVARRLHADADAFARIEARNVGKTLADTRREAGRAAEAFAYYGGWADKATGTTIPVDGPFHTYTRREPFGVVVGIVPWNVPYVFAAKKFAPALAMGNACLLKPAEETPLTALRLAEVLAAAGVPDGVAQVLPGGRATGQALVGDPRADLVVFTGSDQAGRAVAATAAGQLTPVALELGGKSPQLVFADADLDAALEAVLLGVFGASGQMCIAGSRLLLAESIHDPFLDRLAERVRGLKVGDPLASDTQVGPQVTAAQRDKTLRYLAAGRAEGAREVARAELPDDPRLAGGFFAPPTVFADVTGDMSVARDEIFGPVLAVQRFRDEQQALALAHQTEFGLAAGVWTRDLARAHRVAHALEVGTVWLNSYRVLSDLVPFGGVRHSGYGREHGEEAVRLYSRVKSVWTALAPGLPPGYRL
jgi:aldehyde dehydrogenase (NAD+)